MQKENSKILIIDDEPEIRYTLSRFLTRNGFEVKTAGTLKEGKLKIRKNIPDLVFLDVNLPDGNGIEELPDFSSQSAKSVFIIMSAFDHKEAKEKALNLGAKVFLSKPFNIEELNQIVNTYK